MNDEIKHQYSSPEFKPVLNEWIEPASVGEKLVRGAILLTGSAVLAADWKQRLVRETMQQTGQAVVETPAVFSWNAWLSRLAAGQSAIPVVLNRTQEIYLWEQLIRDDMASHTEGTEASIHGLAEHACQAYSLLREYRIAENELVLGSEESEALSRWIRALQKQQHNICRGRILAADMTSILLQSLDCLELPECILLDGFEPLTPRQAQFLAAVQSADCSLLQVKENPTATSQPVLCVANDVEAEYRHVAQCIRDLLEQDSETRIALLSSESVDTGLLRQYLGAALTPEAEFNPAGVQPPVAMPAMSLSDAPLPAHILHLLSMAGVYDFPAEDFSKLLFAPWLRGFDSERMARARLDACFRRQNRHRMSWQSLLHAKQVRALPELTDVIQALAGWKKNRCPASDWVARVHELLKQTGMAESTLNHGTRSNRDIRQMNAFRDVLLSLVAVDAVADSLSWTAFLSLLRQACSEARFVERPRYGNVVVMPLADISGLKFDHVFVLGMDEDAFPLPARSQPLLPASVQKKYAIPVTNSTLAYQASQTIWQHLLQSSRHIVISYAGQRDERELTASAFTAGLVAQPVPDISTACHTLPQQPFDDAAPVPMLADEQVKGGTVIIRNQSACPFRAFASHRLQITCLDETEPGIAPGSKGTLIHLALEYIWRHLQTRKALEALSCDETDALVHNAIEYAWQSGQVFVDGRIRQYEQKRMHGVLCEWLALELERPDFEVIAIEKQYELNLLEHAEPSFRVAIKADRVDCDTAGHRILIDYKTGQKQSLRKWLVNADSERIEEPQLPQYALAAGLGEHDAVSFARVRSGDMGFEGLCGEELGIQGIIACDGKRGSPDDWQQLLRDWRANINRLAKEFVAGRCEVAPRDAGACSYCGLEAVCRIGETGFAGDADMDEWPEGDV